MQKIRVLICFAIIVCLMLPFAACSGRAAVSPTPSPDPSKSVGPASSESPGVSEPAPSEQLPAAEASQPDEVLRDYMAAVNARDYEKMYGMVHVGNGMTKEDFIARNKNIYEGIDAKLEIVNVTPKAGDVVSFWTKMATRAGEISFENEAKFGPYDGAYKIEWDSQMIFPNLGEEDKVSITTTKGERGSILDRNGILLAGKDNVYSVGFVPGKIDPLTRDADIATVAELLDMTVQGINDKLSEKWVKDDLFVPLKKISYTDTAKKEALLQIKGIALNTVKDRVYKLGEKAAHLTGYIGSINAEQLAKLSGLGYTANSKIGKVGLESLLEDRIRGVDGSRITIADKDGKEKAKLAEQPAQDGENVTLTIDAALQEKLYDQMSSDKGAAVVMDPRTGEILALVSTPSYDPNDFILGLSDAKWAAYNDETTRPMLNRFKAAFAPGSAMKPITAAVGLSAGAFTADEDFGPSGLSWQKDAGWGSYKVTTLKQYSKAANVQNALIYSDNIYFAKAALKIGADAFAQGLRSVGFGEDVPFEFGLSPSTFGTDLAFGGEVDLADSGYGQGKVLVNPVHLASIYTAFANNGSMMTPYLEKAGAPTVWKANVFSEDTVKTVRNAMIQVVENPNGTGHSAQVKGLTIAGKTGTAEVKSSKQDTGGTELGWFAAFTADETTARQILAVAMVEDVKDRGGSHYVIPIVRSLFAD